MTPDPMTIDARPRLRGGPIVQQPSRGPQSTGGARNAPPVHGIALHGAQQAEAPLSVEGSPTLAEELASAIGLPWTRGNAVWGPNALDKLRALQHTLMKQAFGMPHDRRAPLLAAVKALELAVALRLRFEECALEEQARLQRGSLDGVLAGALIGAGSGAYSGSDGATHDHPAQHNHSRAA